MQTLDEISSKDQADKEIRLTPMVRSDMFFFYFILILRSALRTIHSSTVAHHWPE